MVWHSHRLNPRIYLEDCLRHGRINLWRSSFPWLPVNSSIDDTTFTYNPNGASRHNFSRSTLLAWINEQDQMIEAVSCFNCKSAMQCPWTTLHEFSENGGSVAAVLARGRQDIDRGLSSKDFEFKCRHCQSINNHQTMRLKKFHDDAMDLIEADVALPGTILSLDGRAITWFKPPGTLDPRTFPNRLVKLTDVDKILRQNEHNRATVDLVRQTVEDGIRSKEMLSTTVSGLKKDRLQRTERVAIRRMLSRYWENSSPFGIDLVGAVVRQGRFIDKMHTIDWLHSPALRSTVNRILVRYDRFLGLMRKYPGKIIVPTLDIDLAWHSTYLRGLSFLC